MPGEVASLSDLIGQALPQNLFDILAARMVTVVVATIDENGWPHTAPYNQIFAPDRERLVLAISRQDETYRSLKDNGMVALAIMEEGDVAVGIKGRASVLCEQMEANCNLAAVEVRLEQVKRDNSPHYLVTQGIRTRLREEPFLLQMRQIMNELRKL